MIPFYLSRRSVRSPIASIINSGAVRELDRFSIEDRQGMAREIKQYGKRYALDWAITAFCFALLGSLLGILISVLFKLPLEEPDYLGLVCMPLLCFCVSFCTVEHLITNYLDALDLGEVLDV